MAETETTTRKTRKKRVDPNETPRERWERLVHPRAERLINTVKLLKNLRGSVYNWDNQVEKKLFASFEAALDELRQAWEIEDKVEEEEVVAEEQEPAKAPAAKAPAKATSGENSDLEW